ncbi:hypothetical protein PMZ80_002387 [Knufia obscura]|uniref:T6SS Phospholipase effector Tle1-like catalytic domain-containing protein n=1 Tax=Knufia obscura TaxID=1635080 RepID=A0ABR0RY79_9EURO|nr:hypothetical protein PMZ80_002387 [Knufia obscura]
MASALPAVDTHAHHEQESSNPTQIHSCPKKRIIVACDGTWMDSDSVDQVPSNVTRIIRAIPPVGVDHTGSEPKPITQVTFYQNGIGTGSGGWYNQYIGKYVSGATGEGLAFNIREAYNFICANYHRGDEVILLGFSRGAFTARSISTFIKQLGLLTPKGLSHLIEITDDWEHQLNKDYKSPYPDEPFSNRPNFSTPEYHKTLHELKMTRQNIDIKCVAVWDTVGALGLPTVALFPQPAAKEFAFVDTRVEDNIEYAFHALGLDEKRRSYAPSIWFKPSEQKLPKVLKQTWFPGVHSDVGGSYANDDIANITLAWMVGQLEEHKLVTFNRDYIVRQVHRTIKCHADETKKLSQNHSVSLERAKTFGPLRRWGLGKIHDSYTLFFKIGGEKTRTPMQHPAVSRNTTKPTGRLLQGTHERMHASVRVRMALDGRGYDDKGQYISEALKDWEYTYGRRAQPDTPFQIQQPGEVGKLKDVEWVKTVTRNGKKEEVARMAEDKMTEFERLILRHWTDAEDNWEEGADERESEVDTARPTARESSRFWESPTSARKSAKGARNGVANGRTNGMQAVRETEEDGVGRSRQLHLATDVD